LGLHDRGRVAIGHKADLNLIDFERLSIQQPVMTSDLPAGGNRILQLATGYIATIVSGKITYRNGEPTGALPRRVSESRARCQIKPNQTTTSGRKSIEMSDSSTMNSVAANKEVVRKFISGIPVRDRNETVVRSTMAENGIWEFQLAGGYSPDLKAFPRATRWTREEMIDMHLGVDPRMKEPYIVTPTSMVAEGDKVVVEAYGSGISRFNERPYRQRYCFHLTLKDGLIVEGTRLCRGEA
jgi:ketosteroid isomerase-like protein